MKTDGEVHRMIRERSRGKTLDQAAARAGMSVPTARKYLRAGQLPSQLKHPRTYRTRADPFAADWPWIQAQLERDSALQAQTLFALLSEQHPERYHPGQVRTLQRRIAAWRALHGPDQEVIFEQVHQPGRMAQSDFTHMTELGITLAGVPFPHLVYHLVLTYSNVEAIQICFSESFEALAEGLEACLWQIGGVPQIHRTDNLSAAVHVLERSGRTQFTDRYLALLAHYGLQPTTNNAGMAHENGDVEQAHYRFKQAVDQALRIRGSRDFADRAAYTLFLQDLVRQRNRTRQTCWETERGYLRPLPALPLAPCRELQVRVSRFSTIRVLHNTYSVPSRLIGTTLTARVRAEVLELYVGTSLTLTVPRLHGRQQQRIDYRHVIWSLLRKPGAFAAYRYRDELFPTLHFRHAYDRLQGALPQQADREYLRILHLAASTSESEVDLALAMFLESGMVPTSEALRSLVQLPRPLVVPELSPVVLDLRPYDQLLGPREVRA
ncbi:MAG: IS21 family transposase [Chloroflexota bacterium]|nr:IS21 family transposase [Chloroflexota bacterium]